MIMNIYYKINTNATDQRYYEEIIIFQVGLTTSVLKNFAEEQYLKVP